MNLIHEPGSVTATAPQFEANAFTSKSVACPTCNAEIGSPCMRPSGHEAASLHASRKALADEKFIACYGADAQIEYDASADRWGVKAGGRFIAHASKGGRKADGGFELRNDPPKQQPERADRGHGLLRRADGPVLT
jgi:hypothetical protein